MERFVVTFHARCHHHGLPAWTTLGATRSAALAALRARGCNHEPRLEEIVQAAATAWRGMGR